MSYLPPIQSLAYENVTITDPDGKLLFRCGRKKADWYHQRGLATRVAPMVLRLNFKPKGPGAQHPFFHQEMENHCVVCGSAKQLTRHHIVPARYRQYFKSKEHNHYDVLLICDKDHHRAEAAMAKLDHILAQLAGNPSEWKTESEVERQTAIQQWKCYSNAKLLHNLRADPQTWAKIPAARQQEIAAQFLQQTNASEITEELLKKYLQRPTLNIADPKGFKFKCIATKLTETGLEPEAIRCCRKFFLETMAPQYLPQHWEVDAVIAQD